MGSWSSAIHWRWWKADKLKEEAEVAIQVKGMAFGRCTRIVSGVGSELFCKFTSFCKTVATKSNTSTMRRYV